MKHVWCVTVNAWDGKAVSIELFNDEKSAHDYADVYRERTTFYRVHVQRKDVR